MSLAQRIRAFFEPESVKMNPAYQGMVAYSDAPKPLTMPKNYRSYVKEGYKGSDTVYKCVSYIARNAAAIPPVLYKDRTKKKRIDNHPILDFLEKPNNEQSGVAYREAVIGFKLLSGNAYQYAIRDKNKPPFELWPLRPDYIQPLVSKPRGILGYQYQWMEDPIPVSEIGHSKYWNPDNDVFGMSPLEAAALMVDQNKAAKLWNLALLQNSARPPGAWTVPTTLSKTDRDKLENRLKEKLQGYKNAGSPPVLDGGLKWENMGIPPGQLDWLEGIQYNAAMIANIYNMPPQLIGDNSASTYNNMKEAKAASYTEAIFPELDDYYALHNMWLVPMYADLANSGAFLYYDKESVEVVSEYIQEQKNAKADRANKLWLSGMIMQNEAREEAGYEKTPGGFVFRIGSVLVPQDKMQDYAKQSLTTPAAPPVPQAEPIEEQPQNGKPDANDTSNVVKRDVPASPDAIAKAAPTNEQEQASKKNANSDIQRSSLSTYSYGQHNNSTSRSQATKEEYKAFMESTLQ